MMKKLLILSLLVGFQDNQGMVPFGMNGKMSPARGKPLKPAYTITSPYRGSHSNLIYATDPYAPGIFSSSLFIKNSFNQENFLNSIWATDYTDYSTKRTFPLSGFPIGQSDPRNSASPTHMTDYSAHKTFPLSNLSMEQSDPRNSVGPIHITDYSTKKFPLSSLSMGQSDSRNSASPTHVTNYSAHKTFPLSNLSVEQSDSRNSASPIRVTHSSTQEISSHPNLATISPVQGELLKPDYVISPQHQNEFSNSPKISISPYRRKSTRPMHIITPSTSGYFSSDERIQPHSFNSEENLKVPTNFKRRNSTQVEQSPTKNNDSTLFKEKLEFYDNFPKEAFLDSEINQTGWTEKPNDFCVTILLGRHVGDKANMNKTAHTSSGHSEINLETVGIDKALSLMTLGYIFKFDAIAGGTSARHDTTARLISSFAPEKQEYKLMKEFNEQKLGHLGGKHEKDILQNPEFIRMFSDYNYKMKKNETEEDENCETGNEVISRFTDGIDKMINSVTESRIRYMKTHAASFPSLESQRDFIAKNMLLYICTSRCTLNWMIKYFTGNMQLPLQLKTILNCNLFCVNYYPNTGKYNVLLNNENMPFCISPLHFSHFALKSPVFSPFIQTFCQKVSRIIEKQEEKQDKKQQLLYQSNSEKLLRTVYLKMLSQSFSYYPEPKRKTRQRAKSN